MKNHPTSASSTAFGLLAWLEETRIALPLKGVECRFDVTGTVASVELDQIYHQNAKRPLDCTYTFPLPAGAAVYRCEVHINGRVIRAKVEAKADAQRIFREQKASGRRVALVETERENVFTLTLGNVQPEDLVVVRFAWFQVLDRVAGGMRLLVPTCPGVRYIPGEPLLRASRGHGFASDTDQVPDASRITPPRIDALHRDAAYFSVEGRLSLADAESGTVSSPSHPIYVREQNERVRVELSSRGKVPDCDFVLAWKEPIARQLSPHSWRWTERGETYAFVQLRAPVDAPIAADFPQDFYFLVDRSGSMQGAKWQRTCEALHAFVRLLGPDDRVWITLFESSFQDFAEAPMPAVEVLADPGFQRMEALGVAGGTELLPAAEHVLVEIAAHSAERRANVVLITDGQVGNDRAITAAFLRVPKVRVHTFGIDTAVNDAFLSSLARQQRGGCWLQTPDDDIAGTIAALGARLRRPVLTDLAIDGAGEAGRDAWPDLHADETVGITLRGALPDVLSASGHLPDGSLHRFTIPFQSGGSEAIRLLWARERIDSHLAAGRAVEAVALAKWHNLLCEGAAFIAWDEAEKVEIATELFVQPAQREALIARAATVHAVPSLRRMSVSARQQSAPDHMCDQVNEAFGSGVESWLPRPQAESSLIHSVTDTFRQLGIPSARTNEAIAWAQSEPQETVSRLSSLQMLGQLIGQTRETLPGVVAAGAFKACVDQVMSGSPVSQIAWFNSSNGVLDELYLITHNLIRAGAPEEVIDYLHAWIFEKPEEVAERATKLQKFSVNFRRNCFSQTARGRKWGLFFDEVFPRKSEAHAVASRWLQSRAGAAV